MAFGLRRAKVLG